MTATATTARRAALDFTTSPRRVVYAYDSRDALWKANDGQKLEMMQLLVKITDPGRADRGVVSDEVTRLTQARRSGYHP